MRRLLAPAYLLLAILATAAEKPNIVLIMTDDQGWWDVSSHGNKDIETPIMDRLAAEGVEFTNFHAQPVCAPTRASLMTGRHYLRTGVYNTRFGGDNMDAEEVTLAELLRDNGYRTGIFGKWHLGRYQPRDAASQGFDESLTLATGHAERYYYPDQLRHNGQPIESRGHITSVFTDAAIEFVRNSRARPFFLYLAYNAPHEPHFVPNAYLEKYLAKGLSLKEALIYAMVTHTDEHIGRLLAALDEAGLRDDTIVIFLSDNGGISRHYKAGLRGNKASAYEGGTRVPFFARWPGQFPSGAKVDAMAWVGDILPTVCELLRIPLPAARPVDGKSILPLLRDGRGDSPHEYLHAIWDRHSPRADRSNWSIRGTRYKLVKGELYDLEKDPGEEHNIAGEQPEVAAKLRREFEAWLAEVTAGRPFAPPPIPVGLAGENPVEIQASWATLDGTHVTWRSPGWGQTSGPDALGDPPPGGHVNYTFAGYDWDTVDGWKNPGERAHWVIDVARAGTYEVTVAYGASQAEAGGVFRMAARGTELKATVEPTLTRDVFRRHTVGVLQLTPGLQRLTVEVVSAPGRELMALNRIWLKRNE